MTVIKVVLACAFVLTLIPMANAADIPEQAICAAALERLFDRRSISHYVKTATEGSRKVHLFASRKDSRNTDACYVQGNRVIWRVESAPGMSQGRWRNDPRDEVVTYSLSGDKLSIALKYSDDSGDSQTFSLSKVTEAIK